MLNTLKEQLSYVYWSFYETPMFGPTLTKLQQLLFPYRCGLAHKLVEKVRLMGQHNLLYIARSDLAITNLTAVFPTIIPLGK